MSAMQAGAESAARLQRAIADANKRQDETVQALLDALYLRASDIDSEPAGPVWRHVAGMTEHPTQWNAPLVRDVISACRRAWGLA